MTESIGITDWMSAATTRAVVTALEARGGRDSVRFVGGAVRNALMGWPVEDIDIATVLSPTDATAALEAAGLKVIPTGIAHGTVTAIANRQPFEVTTLRRDVATDGRRAVVAYTTDWAEDAQRRDFRLNAIYADGQGRLFDPTGGGVDDALAGRIVFVGEADQRIREDYLRILRFFRFYAWYGRGEADAVGLAACSTLKDGLAGLSAERVSKELLKLLTAKDPVSAVRLMAESGVLHALVPEASGDLSALAKMVEVDGDPLLRLAALLPDDGPAVRAVAERLRLSKAQQERLVAMQDRAGLSPHMPKAEGRRWIHEIGWTAFRDRLLLNFASASPSPVPLLTALEGWSAPPMPVASADVAALGVSPGPSMGEVLRRFQAWWVANDFPTDRAAALTELKAIVAL